MAAGRSPCIVRARTVSTNGVREGPCPMIAGTGGGATAERGAMVFLKFIRHCHGEAGGSPRPCSGGRPIARSPCRSGRSRTANEFRFRYFSCRKVACPALAADTSGLLRRRGRGASDAVRIKPFVRRTVAGPLVRRQILANDCVRVCRHVRRQTDGGPQAVGRWRRKGKVRSFVPQTLPVSDRVRLPPLSLRDLFSEIRMRWTTARALRSGASAGELPAAKPPSSGREWRSDGSRVDFFHASTPQVHTFPHPCGILNSVYSSVEQRVIEIAYRRHAA